MFTDVRKEKKTKNAAVILRCSEARIKPDMVLFESPKNNSLTGRIVIF